MRANNKTFCIACQKPKQSEDFDFGRRVCILCSHTAEKKAYEDKKNQDPEFLKKRKNRDRQNRLNNPQRHLWNGAKHRAKRDHLRFTITKEDIIIPKQCPVLGIDLFPAEGKPTANSPTIDRTDNNKGYIPKNIAVISYRANSLKRDASFEEIEKLYCYLKKTKGL